jgi:hypothetical protein
MDSKFEFLGLELVGIRHFAFSKNLIFWPFLAVFDDNTAIVTLTRPHMKKNDNGGKLPKYDRYRRTNR